MPQPASSRLAGPKCASDWSHHSVLCSADSRTPGFGSCNNLVWRITAVGLIARVMRISVRSRTVRYNSIRNSLMRFHSSAILGFALLLGAGQAMAQGAPAQSSTATDSAIASAHKAADVWLDQLDGAQYGPSWDNAGSAFQHALTKAQWIATVQKVRGQVGPLGPRTVQKSQFTTTAPNLPPGEYVVMQYRTVSGSGGFVTETVVLQRDGARGWRVDGYFVKPA